MKFDFKKLQLKNIDGKIVVDSNLHKTVANTLWHNAKTLDLVDTAMLINKGESVELEKKEVLELEQLIKDPKSGIFAFAQKQIIDFIRATQKAVADKAKKDKEKK